MTFTRRTLFKGFTAAFVSLGLARLPKVGEIEEERCLFGEWNEPEFVSWTGRSVEEEIRRLVGQMYAERVNREICGL